MSQKIVQYCEEFQAIHRGRPVCVGVMLEPSLDGKINLVFQCNVLYDWVCILLAFSSVNVKTVILSSGEIITKYWDWLDVG